MKPPGQQFMRLPKWLPLGQTLKDGHPSGMRAWIIAGCSLLLMGQARPAVQEPPAPDVGFGGGSEQGTSEEAQAAQKAAQEKRWQELGQKVDGVVGAQQQTTQEVSGLRQDLQTEREAQAAQQAQALADQQNRASAYAEASAELTKLRPDVLHETSDYDQLVSSAQTQLDRATAAGAQGEPVEQAQAALDRLSQARENGDLFQAYRAAQDALWWLGRLQP